MNGIPKNEVRFFLKKNKTKQINKQKNKQKTKTKKTTKNKKQTKSNKINKNRQVSLFSFKIKELKPQESAFIHINTTNFS